MKRYDSDVMAGLSPPSRLYLACGTQCRNSGQAADAARLTYLMPLFC
jgi:hypothetical protein